MLIIPPQSQRSNKPATQHDTTVGMFVVMIIMLCIALFIFIGGPRSHNPPPPLVGWFVVGLSVLFAIVAFFSWLKEQGDDAAGSHEDNSHSES